MPLEILIMHIAFAVVAVAALLCLFAGLATEMAKLLIPCLVLQVSLPLPTPPLTSAPLHRICQCLYTCGTIVRAGLHINAVVRQVTHRLARPSAPPVPLAFQGIRGEELYIIIATEAGNLLWTLFCIYVYWTAYRYLKEKAAASSPPLTHSPMPLQR